MMVKSAWFWVKGFWGMVLGFEIRNHSSTKKSQTRIASSEKKLMSTAKKFEDLTVCKEAFVLTSLIYEMTRTRSLANDPSFISQIRRASVSVMNNIAEGFERKGSKEFVHFLYIAKASCGEIRSMLHLADNLNYLDRTNYQSLLEKVTILQRRLGSLIKYLRQKS